jgi:hypothetical protein
MGLIDVYRINPADQFSVFSPSLRKTQEITYYTLLAKIRGDLNITSTSGNAAQWDEAYRETIVSGAVTGYQTKTITLTRRDGSEISFSFQDLNPIPEDTLDMVTTRGNTTVNTISVGGVLTPWVDLDTSYSNGNIVGRISWDQDNATMDVGLNENTILKVGQDDLWYVKNQTGSTIPKGTVVMAVGTLGASGRILVAPMVADGSVSPKYILGIASEAIEDGSDGYVLAKGKLRQINTAAYVNGQVLWCNPASPGGLTATEPQAPNLKLPIAFVVNAASNGTLAVRINTGSTLSENNQVQFGTLLNNDVLTYVSANSRWQNVPISTLAATAAFSTIAVTGQSSIVADSVSDTLTVASGTAISITTNASTDTLTITNTAPDQIVSLTGAGTTLITGTYPNFTITSNDQYVGTVTSVGLTMPSAFTVTNSPITSSGTIAVTGAGTASQYIRGDGQLADFPTSSGGGSSVSYYLNGSVNQGTFGGNVYREFSKTPIIGAGTDFTIAADGYIAQFITDANDPSLLEIPGGNWNFEFYFSSSSSGGTPSFYVELSKYDGTTFTPIANNSAFPEFISFGTIVSAYFGAIAVPQTTLAVTDRLAIRVYVIHSGRTITLHTENGHLCQVITTFSTGLNALNGLTKQVQYFATGTTGTDFSINSVTDTHTFNLPTASSVNRGALSSADWITFNGKADFSFKTIAVAGQSSIVADAADDTLTVASGTGITLTTNASTDTLTITNNAPDQTVVLTAGTGISTSGTYPSFTITNTAPDQTVVLTAGTGITTSGTYPNFTITNAAPDQVVSITGAGTTVVTGTYPNFTVTSNDQYDGTVTSVDLTAGSGITVSGGPITTSGSITVTNSDRGSSQNIFKNIAVPTQSTITAANNNDTFTLKPGPGVSITTLTTNNNITINNTDPGSSQYIFKNIAVSGQSTIVADINDDTLTVASGTGISVTTDAVTDTLTFTNTAPDQTVALTAGTGISVAGTYPNFTITNSSPSSGGTVTSIATTAPITGGTITSTGTIGITQAGASTDGYLSSTDWNTFNNKQPALTNPITGTGTTNYVSKFTGTTTLGDSQIFDNGTNVGIGTASPVSALSIYKASGNAYIEISGNGNTLGSTSMLYGQDGGSSGYVWNRANAPVYFGTNNSTKMFLNTNGYLGIGTTNPGALLQIGVSNVTTDALLRLGVSYDTSRSSRGGITWHDESNTTGKIYTEYDGTMVSMVFGSLYNSGYNSNNLMIIRGNGNVGIGTTTPSEKLRVNGTFSSNSLWTDSGAVSYWGGYPTAFGGLTWDTGYATVFATAGNSLQFGSNGASPDMVIDTSGNVGIGTTSPDARLQITQTGGTQLKIVSGDAFGSQDVVIDLVSAYDYRGRGILYRNSTDNNKWFSGVPYTGGGYSIGYSDTTPEYHANSKLFVSSGGNVGIGTTSPSHKLQVVTNAVAGKQNMAAIDRTAGNLIRFTNPQYSTDASMGLLLRVFPDSDARQGAGIIASGGANNATTDLDLFVTTSPDGLGGTSYSAVKINGLNGNVGIGNTSPATKLDVNGSINIANGNNLTWGGAYGAGIPTIVGYNAGTGGALYFYPNGSTSGEKMRLHASGNLSIGNTNDTFKLDVSGTGRFTNEIYVGGVWSTSYGPRVSGDPIKFLNWSGGELARIDTTSGNVGIGTTSPAQKFHVQGSNLMATFRNSSTSANQYTQLEFIAGSRDAYIWLGNQNTTDWAGDGGLNIYTGTGNMDFWTAATQKMRITSTGNVGIGTTSPAASLHVGATGGVIFGPTAGAVGTAQITTQNPVSPVSTRFAFGTDGTGWQYRIAKNTAGTIVDLVTVADSGNVGIGTTSPSAKLNVSGDIHLGDYGSASVRVLDFRTSNSVFEIATNGTSGALGTTMTYSWANGGQGPLKFNNAAGEVMRLSPTGNVGIGTTSPASILHLFKTSYPVLTIGSGTVTGNVGIDTGNNFMSVGTETNHPLSFATNNSAKMRITPGGSLLLGDNITPGETSWFGTAVFGKNGTDKVITGYLTSLTNGAVIGGHNSALNAWANLNIVGTNVIFRDGSESERMRIASGGNVGIGTTSPAHKLSVVGSGTGIAHIGDAGFGSGNYTGISLNGTLSTANYNFLSSPTDSDLYINRPSTRAIRFREGNSDQVSIVSGGNVGIGTTSPYEKLEVAGAISATGAAAFLSAQGHSTTLAVSGGTSYLYAVDWGAEFKPLSVQGKTISLETGTGGTSARVTIDNSGNVGIGTTSPTAKLEVIGQGSGSVKMGSTGFGGDWVGISLSGNLNTTDYNLLSSATNASFFLNRPSGGDMLFRHNNVDQMIIKSSGNVGIGTTAPGGKLEVNFTASQGATSFILKTSDNPSANGTIRWQNSSSGNQAGIGSNFNVSDNGALEFLNGNTTNMIIRSSGNVGIGTTNPVSLLNLNNGDAFINVSDTIRGLQFGFAGPTHGSYRAAVMGGAESYGGTDGGMLTFHTQNGYVVSAIPPERMRITSAGNVGIGTTSPASLLYVGAATNFVISGRTASVVGPSDSETILTVTRSGTDYPQMLDFGVSNSGLYSTISARQFTTSENKLILQPNGGNVGIGTTSPGDKLTVSGGITGNTLTLNSGAGISVTSYGFLSQTISGQMTFLGHNIRASDSVANTAIVQNAGWISSLMKMYYSDGITFHTDSTVYAAGATYPLSTTERLRITPAGNVGIGTDSPKQKLDVAGAGSVIAITNTSNTSYGELLFYESSTVKADIFVNGSSQTNYAGANSMNIWQGSNAPMAFYTNGTNERMRITGGGNIGIGTTSPATKLHVEGRIFAADIGIGTTSPTQKLHVVGNARITGWVVDSLNTIGNPGDVLTSTSTGIEWLPGGGGGGGTTITVKEEGTTVSSSISTLNFVGSNVNATASGSTATISVRDNVGTGSQYLNAATTNYAIPGSYTDTVQIDGTDIIVAAPNSPKATETVIAILTFGILNVVNSDAFNAFYFRLYNASTATPITDTEHRWSSYMSANEPTTVATFHIPIKINDFAQGDDIYVQCQTSVLDAPEIYYCALSFIKGTE